MNTRVRDELDQLGIGVRFDEPLAKYGTYRIGGPAAALLRATSVEDVSKAVRCASRLQLPLLVIGLGSNVLFDDAGFDGLVIRVASSLGGITTTGPNQTEWTVGAGLPIPQLARRSVALGLAGAQRLVGVPGAVGGGVFMNAGAHQQDFAQLVRSVALVTLKGDITARRGEDIAWQYRSSGLTGVVVEVTLSLEPADPKQVKRELTECLRRRRAGTPFDQPCCGSVFRNPSEDEIGDVEITGPHTAGRLIEAVGLKGFRVGGAEVSTLHANYVVNTGGATAADVKSVVRTAQQRVQEAFGVRLHREVQFIGTSGIETGNIA